jgi:hypothetical protein
MNGPSTAGMTRASVRDGERSVSRRVPRDRAGSRRRNRGGDPTGRRDAADDHRDVALEDLAGRRRVGCWRATTAATSGRSRADRPSRPCAPPGLARRRERDAATGRGSSWRDCLAAARQLAVAEWLPSMLTRCRATGLSLARRRATTSRRTSTSHARGSRRHGSDPWAQQALEGGGDRAGARRPAASGARQTSWRRLRPEELKAAGRPPLAALVVVARELRALSEEAE